MKTWKKISALFAVFSLVLTMMPVVPIQASQDEPFDLSWADPENEEITILEADELTELEKEALLQIPAVKASNALGEYFSNAGYKDDEIPEYYGGAYINEQQQLVIKIVSGNEEIYTGITNAMPSDASFIIEEVDVSLTELMSFQEDITSLYRNILATSGISQKDSMVNVEILSEYAEIIPFLFSTYKNNTDISSHIQFHVTEERPQLTSSLIGGNPLYTKENGWNYIGTLGFCGTFKINNTQMNCVLTAGHVAKGRKLYYGANNSAGDAIIQFTDMGYGDYALVTTGANILTNLVRLDQTTTGKITSYSVENISSAFEGRMVYKYGITTGLTAGKIEDFNTSSSVSGENGPITILGLTSVLNESIPFCDSGDSGGPVWYIQENGTRQLYGIISAKNNMSPTVGYFSRLYYPYQNNSYQPKLN